MLDAALAGSDTLTSSTESPSEPSQGPGVEHSVWCEVRILHAQPAMASDDGPSRLVTVRYVAVSERGATRMGVAEVDVADIGGDFDVRVESITKGPALPESLHSAIEEAACAAYQHAADSWRALDNFNADLSSAYLFWRENGDPSESPTVEIDVLSIRQLSDEAWRRLAMQTGADGGAL